MRWLQETKLSKLEHEFARVAGYEAYHAISRSKKGYSGVATYVRIPDPSSSTPTPMPMRMPMPKATPLARARPASAPATAGLAPSRSRAAWSPRPTSPFMAQLLPRACEEGVTGILTRDKPVLQRELALHGLDAYNPPQPQPPPHVHARRLHLPHVARGGGRRDRVESGAGGECGADMEEAYTCAGRSAAARAAGAGSSTRRGAEEHDALLVLTPHAPAPAPAHVDLFTASECLWLDGEGRAVLTHHGAFALLNAYFPARSGPYALVCVLAYKCVCVCMRLCVRRQLLRASDRVSACCKHFPFSFRARGC